MSQTDDIDPEVQRIIDEIQTALSEACSAPYKPVTPDLIKKELMRLWEEKLSEPPLEIDVDYRMDVDGSTLTITPLSERCIRWFREKLETPVYEVTFKA